MPPRDGLGLPRFQVLHLSCGPSCRDGPGPGHVSPTVSGVRARPVWQCRNHSSCESRHRCHSPTPCPHQVWPPTQPGVHQVHDGATRTLENPEIPRVDNIFGVSTLQAWNPGSHPTTRASPRAHIPCIPTARFSAKPLVTHSSETRAQESNLLSSGVWRLRSMRGTGGGWSQDQSASLQGRRRPLPLLEAPDSSMGQGGLGSGHMAKRQPSRPLLEIPAALWGLSILLTPCSPDPGPLFTNGICIFQRTAFPKDNRLSIRKTRQMGRQIDG